MTSPVDTSVKFYSSQMSGAPVLSGTAGALIVLLDACLKDGFDTKTLTSLVATGGVMTATWASGNHSSQTDAVVLVAGVTGGPTGFAGANGEQKVVGRPTATTATWATTLPDGTYTGTITIKMAPAGFAKPFSGTNLGAYKSGDITSTGCYLRVDDTGTTSCRVVGYESMSDINTGVGPFPSPAQVSGGGYWAKSQNANSTAVAWSLFTNGKIFYLNIQSSSATNAANQITAGRCFGDLTPYKPGGDPYACVLNYSTTSTVSSMYDGAIGTSNEASFAAPRDYTGLGSSTINKIFPFLMSFASVHYSGGSTGLGAFPSPVDGGLWLSQKFFATSALIVPRALMPGILHCMQTGAWDTFRQGDRTPGSGLLAGRTLIAATASGSSGSLTGTSASSNTGIVFFDATGPW
ncbi:MAG: hypothetical protein ACT6S0_23550 [Roseateles sp.]|uniref:hypothetical protein n=1 Tax=Roseateles sp. TaxID=1971397 RepID=UPI00403518E6